jgi:starvation-inducible DNA-binding protein
MAESVLTRRADEIPVRTGIEREDRKRLVDILNNALAATFVLYAKTLAYHWNVAGPLFYSVHKLTDDQYHDLADAIDATAERIRALGFPALGGVGHYIQKSIVADVDKMPDAGEMVAILARDHQAMAKMLRDAVGEAEKVEDVYTADFLTGRIGVHEEAAWMLNATIAD